MGQYEVFIFLKKMRSHNETYYSIADIIKALNILQDDINNNTRKHVRQLYAFGYLEIESTRQLPWRYRLKASCLEANKVINPLNSKITSKELRALK